MRLSCLLGLAFFSPISAILTGCLDPSLDVAGGASFPQSPPPELPYQCAHSVTMTCPAPRFRVWLPGWYILETAARGNKVAFAAYPNFPTGGVNQAEPKYLGQVSLDTGDLDWIVPIGKNQEDVYTIYDLTITPKGDVVVGASGYGELLLGNKMGQFDGFIASFDSSGKKRFAQRLDNTDNPPVIERPRLINLKILANENIFVHTAWHVTPLNQPTKVPLFLYAFTPIGTMVLRQEIPITAATYNGSMWAVPDGTMWSKAFPGPFRRYSQQGEILDMFELQPDVDMPGFAATSAKTMLINLTTKGMTNELYRYDVGGTMTALFSESAFPEFHASDIKHSLNLAATYFVALKYSGLSHRIQSIDTNGTRGSATTVQNVHSRFTILDNGDAVLVRQTDFGTEFIVQPL